MSEQDDDKPTLVLDLNALKKQKLKAEEDLANLASELEFNIQGLEIHSEVKIILFDFQSDFFQKSQTNFPKGFEYLLAHNLKELNQFMKSKDAQIVVFNYDVNPKAVNQLCAQIKQKLSMTKTLIIAKAISPTKAKLHSKTPSGADGYFQLPLEPTKLENEFLKIQMILKKVG